MNMQPHADPSKTPQKIWEDFSLSFTPAVREVVEFSKHIPGFSSLSQNDQITLLKAGTFEVLQTCQYFGQLGKRFQSVVHKGLQNSSDLGLNINKPVLPWLANTCS